MKEKEPQIMSVDNMLALISILPKYLEFEEALSEFLKGEYNRDLVEDLRKYADGEVTLTKYKAKKFYKRYYNEINLIGKYTNIGMFICSSYDTKGNMKKKSNLNYFYNYLKDNEDKLEDIKKLLLKLKELGISDFEFDPTLDFTKEEYDLDKEFGLNYTINYLDNMKALPNYRNLVKYKSEGSNYLLTVTVRYNDISDYWREIKLNSLTFDRKRLPFSIDKEEIFDKIVNLEKEVNNKTKKIRDSVELGIGITDFERQFEKLSYIVYKLENIKDKSELRSVLTNIKKEIDELKAIDRKNNKKLVDESKDLTEELIEKEKQKYLSIRDFKCLDLC